MTKFKKTARAVIIFAIVVLAFALLLSTHFEGKSDIGTNEKYGLSDFGDRDITDMLDQDYEAFSENGRTLWVSEGGIVRLKDDHSGEVLWQNVADKEDIRVLGTEEAADSPLSITYRYNGETDIRLYSELDAVDMEQYTVGYTEDKKRLRVQYLFGEAGESGILPVGITKEYMEQDVLPKLNKEQQEYLLRRYVLYTAETAKSTVIDACPGVKKTPLYYLEDCTAVTMKKKTIQYLSEAGLTQEIYQKQCILTGEVEKKYNESYLVTMEYWLEGGDLMLRIPCNELKFHPENPLTILSLNGAATYAENKEQGYYLLPAGSGAIQSFTSDLDRDDTYSYIGKNTLDKDSLAKESSFPLPVYGIIREEGCDMMAVIETGGEIASLKEKYNGGASQLTLNFQILEYGNSSVTKQQTSTVFGASSYTGDILVRYCFFNDATYSTMANYYREHILKQRLLPETMKNTDSLMLEFIGNVRRSEEWFGLFSVTKNIPLTTYSQGMSICQEVLQTGVSGLSVKLSGFNQGGLFFQKPGSYTWSKSLGSGDERTTFLNWLSQKGIDSYLDVNMAYFYQPNNSGYAGYNSQKYNSRLANKEIATLSIPSKSTGAASSKAGIAHILSPFWFQGIADQYNQKLAQTLGVSIGDSTLFLNVDFSNAHYIDRTTSCKNIANAITQLSKSRAVMSQNPILPTLKNIQIAEQLKLKGDESYPVTCYVPFVQMVLHGHVNYTSDALNSKADYKTALLEAIETGSALKYTLTGNMDPQILDTEYDYLYYTDYTQWKGTILSDAKSVRELYDGLAGLNMINHEMNGSLRKVTYANGTSIYINYGNTPEKWGSVTIPARGYCRVDK